MQTYILDYFRNFPLVQHLIQSFVQLTALDIQIISLNNNTPFKYLCSIKNQKKAQMQSCLNPDCCAIPADVMDEMTSTKKTRFFMCPAGMTRILVPLSTNNSLDGMLCVGETPASALDKMKFTVVSDLVSRVANYILENEANSLRSFKGTYLTSQQKRLHKILSYIKANIQNHKLTLQTVANENGVSYYYLSHLFKKELNTTFVDYCKIVRMQMAAKLLKDCSMTISQVSYACGYDDASYFCKVFKIVFGIAPGKFRKKIMLKHKHIGIVREQTGIGWSGKELHEHLISLDQNSTFKFSHHKQVDL